MAGVGDSVIASTNRIDSIIPVIEFKSVELHAVIQNLASQAGINFVFDPKIQLESSINWRSTGAKPPPNLTLSWTNLTARQALKAVLANYGLHLVEINGTTVSKVTFTNLNTELIDLEWTHDDTNTIPLIQFQGVLWSAALETLARQANLKITIEPGLERNAPTDTGWHPSELTVRWKDLTSRQAIAALCETYALSIEHDKTGDSIRITGNRLGNSKSKVKNERPNTDKSE